MTPMPLIAAMLGLALTLAAGPAWAQEDGGEETEAPSGPVMRRPPPNDDVGGVPIPPAREEEPEPDVPPAVEEDAPAVVEVLDPSVFEGVFAPYTVRDGRTIPEPLAGEPGDPVQGRRLFHNFSRTGCSLCHGTAEAPRAPDSVRTAPPLHRVAERLTPGRLRLWIVAPETIRPKTTMPAFHKPGQRTNIEDPLYGGPRLTAAEVEDLVAYLSEAGMSESE